MQGYKDLKIIYKSDRVTVFRALRESDGLSVILKTQTAEYPSPRDLMRIQYEYELSQRFPNLGIVPILGLAKVNNGYNLIMEDVGGIPLLEYWFNSNKSISLFLNLSIQITKILANLHKNNIIHKDIKPPNILVQNISGKVYLIDLGLATQLTFEEQAHVQPEALEGTLSYISPEQTGRMNRIVDFRSDLYSLGVTFYEILTGKVPFNFNEPIELIHAHIAISPTPPNIIDNSIPESISEMILKLLSKNAEDRYFSALGLLEDLLLANNLQNSNKPLMFIPGERESKGFFSIPQKLYGREVEVAFLLSAFDRIAESPKKALEDGETESYGGVKLVLVGGYSGVGKTSLINEIHKPITKKNGSFVSGKFDQFKRNTPYSAFIQAFSGLIRQILSKKEESIQIWKEKIGKVCESDLSLLLDLIPDLTHIISKEANSTDNYFQEDEEKFRSTFKNFIGIFANENHPLIIFIDDLQWADTSTLKFIDFLTKSRDLHHVLLLGAYRDNEVDSFHPLSILIKNLENDNINFLKIILSPLMEFFIERMICDTFKREVELELPNLVHKKTGGNPFFVRQFLKTLFDDNCIIYDPDKGWIYDLEKIESSNYTENIVDLLVKKIKSFSTETQEILKISSCIGNKFSLKILSLVLKSSLRETANALKESLKEGLLQPENLAYRQIEISNISELESESLDIQFRFLHDRVQQASYTLLSEDEKIEIHVKIGKVLLNQKSYLSSDERLFETVNHLNFGIPILDSLYEKEELLDLNLRASKKALETYSYESVNNYCNKGLLLINSKTTEEKIFTLNFEYLSSNYKSGRVEETIEKIDNFFILCTTNFQRAKVFNLKVECLIYLEEYENSIATCIQALKIFDIEIKSNISNRDIFIYYKSLSKKLKDKTIDDLYSLPLMDNKEISIVMEILMNTSGAAYSKNPTYGMIFSFIMVEFSLKYGNTYTSSFAYSIYGFFLSSIGEYKISYQFGQLAINIYNKIPHDSTSIKIPFEIGNHINIWVLHLKKSIEIMMNAFNQYSNIKDIPFSSSMIANSYNISFLLGSDLKKSMEYFKSYIPFLQINHSDIFFKQCTFINQFIKTLMDEEVIWINFQSNVISESEFELKLHSSEYYVVIYQYYTLKMYVNFILGNLNVSLEAYSAILPLRNFGGGIINSVQDIFISALLLLKVKSSEVHNKDSKILKELNGYLNQLKVWSEINPSNFKHKYSIVMAEFNFLQKDYWSASVFYDEAISQAVANEYILEAALCCELAGAFYEKVNRKKTAIKIFTDSYYYYNLCGAIAKSKIILQKNPNLSNYLTEKSSTIHSSKTYTSFIGTTKLDIDSITKVTSALSAELNYESLLQKLLSILLENAGAERGILMLMRDDNLYIEAEGNNKLRFQSFKKKLAFEYNELPINVVQYCFNSNKSIILDSAFEDTEFGNNIFIQQNKIRSLLCVPILSKGKLLGILYLENTLTAGAFTKDRIEILNIITSQAAISIENARLYESLSVSNKELELTNDRVTKAYLDLEASQKQLVQSDKMITLGTMVAGVAHEINTPLSAIKANSENISDALKNLLEIINPSLNSITIEDLQNSLALLQFSKPSSNLLSSRETRNLKKNVCSKLESIGHTNPDILADKIMEMGLHSDLEAKNELLIHPNLEKILTIAHDLFGIQKKSTVIKTSAERVSKIVKSLKSFMHFDQSEEKKPADLIEGMETVLIILHNKLKYGIEVVKNYGDVPQILCFSDELNQIWTNLIHNAIQAMGESGTLHIEMEKVPGIFGIPDIDKRNPNYTDEYVSISIQDSGPGIPLEIRDKIFQAFFTTKKAGEGSGLGLHIIGKILEKHNGALYLESEPGKTRFSVLIPIADK